MSSEEKPKTEFLTYSQIHNFLNNQGGESESFLFQTKTSLSQDLSEQFLFKTISNNMDDKSFNFPSSQMHQSLGNVNFIQFIVIFEKESQTDLAYSISQVQVNNFPSNSQMTPIDEASLGQESSSNVTNLMDANNTQQQQNSDLFVNQKIKGLDKNQQKMTNTVNNTMIEKLQTELINLKDQNIELNFELQNQQLRYELAEQQMKENDMVKDQNLKKLQQSMKQLKVESELKIEEILKKQILSKQQFEKKSQELQMIFQKQQEESDNLIKNQQLQIDKFQDCCSQLQEKQIQLESNVKEKDQIINNQIDEINKFKEQLKLKEQKIKSLEDFVKRTDKDVKNQNQKLKELQKENEELKKQSSLKQSSAVVKNTNSTKLLLFQMEQEQQNLMKVTQNIKTIQTQLENELIDHNVNVEISEVKKLNFPHQQSKLINQQNQVTNQNQIIPQNKLIPQNLVNPCTSSTSLQKSNEQLSQSFMKPKAPLIIVNQLANATFPSPIYVQFPSQKNTNGIKKQ